MRSVAIVPALLHNNRQPTNLIRTRAGEVKLQQHRNMGLGFFSLGLIGAALGMTMTVSTTIVQIRCGVLVNQETTAFLDVPLVAEMTRQPRTFMPKPSHHQVCEP